MHIHVFYVWVLKIITIGKDQTLILFKMRGGNGEGESDELAWKWG